MTPDQIKAAVGTFVAGIESPKNSAEDKAAAVALGDLLASFLVNVAIIADSAEAVAKSLASIDLHTSGT